MNKTVIIQARMTSSRLPGKVMADIDGQPMLQHMLGRVQRAKAIDGVVLATTSDRSDDILEQFCHRQGIACYRGSLHDVLDRYYQAASHFNADVIIRLTADCPLIDPEVIDRTVALFLGDGVTTPQEQNGLIPGGSSSSEYPFHFVADRLPPPWKRTLPIGLDIEVCSYEALEEAWQRSDQRYQREHVMPYLYEGVTFPKRSSTPQNGWYIHQGTTPRGFRVALLNHSPDYGAQRWTVDTRADLEFIRQVFTRFKGQTDFSWLDVLALLKKEPELASINADVKHKSAFDVDQRSSQP